MSVKKVILIVSVLTILVTGAIGYAGYRLLRSYITFLEPTPIPAQLEEARVLKGGERITRSELFKLEKNSNLASAIWNANLPEKEIERATSSNIAIGIYSYSDMRWMGDQLVAVGKFGAQFFNRQGEFVRSITFEPINSVTTIGGLEKVRYELASGDYSIVDLGSGRVGFLTVNGTSGANLFNDAGDIIFSTGSQAIDISILIESEADAWERYDKSESVKSAAVGDLDGDGAAELVVARSNDGIRAYTQTGSEIWSVAQSEPGYEMQILDLDGDGSKEILMVGRSILSSSGQVLKVVPDSAGDAEKEQFSPPVDRSRLSVFPIRVDDGKLEIKQDGATVFHASAPLSSVPSAVENRNDLYVFSSDVEKIYDTKAVWLKLFNDKEDVLAVVGNFILFPRSNLYVYDKFGNLIYHELLNENAETIAAFSEPDGTESILVGGSQTIWKFRRN